MDIQRQLLAQLMDPLLPAARKPFTDPDVCTHHLVAFCPFELFTNTKIDIGKCSKVHSDDLAIDYRRSDSRGKLGYEHLFNVLLVRLVADIDRQIRKGHQRLSNPANMVAQVSSEETRENIVSLQALAEPKLEALEHYGRLGRVKEAFDMWLAIEKIHEELEFVQQDDVSSVLFRPDKRMEVL